MLAATERNLPVKVVQKALLIYDERKKQEQLNREKTALRSHLTAHLVTASYTAFVNRSSLLILLLCNNNMLYNDCIQYSIDKVLLLL